MSRDPMECEQLVVRTRAAARRLMPSGFDFVLVIRRFDGEELEPMAVEDAEQVATLIHDLMPERLSVEVGKGRTSVRYVSSLALPLARCTDPR